MTENLLSIKKAAQYLDVTEDCLRKWDANGKLKPLKTAGGHRRYKREDLDALVGIKKQDKPTNAACAIYVRVSSNDQKQKGDLDRQSQRLYEYCVNKRLPVTHIIKDVGSGLNDNRSGFLRLTDLIVKGEVNTLVVEHKDRLTRFQFPFVQRMFESYGCKVIVVHGTEVSDDHELAADMISLLASFSGRFYGKRSAERRKKKTQG